MASARRGRYGAVTTVAVKGVSMAGVSPPEVVMVPVTVSMMPTNAE